MLNIFNKNIPPDCSDRRDEVKLLVSLFSILSHSTTTHLTLPLLPPPSHRVVPFSRAVHVTWS